MPNVEPPTLRSPELSDAAGVWRLPVPDGVLTFSRGMFGLLGLDEAAGMPSRADLRALVHPEDLGFLVERVRAAARGDAPRAFAFRIVRPDGIIRSLVGAADVETGEGGAIRAVVGSARDVTSHDLTDDAVRRSEDRLRQTVDGVDAIIVYRAHDDDPLVFSEQLRRILGYDPATFTAFDDWNRIVHPDDLPRCRAVWDANPATWAIEYRVRRSDGAWIWIADRGRRTPGAADRGAGVFSIIVDVTERHLAAARIAASEARLRRIYDADLVGLATVDARGVVTESNAYFTRMVGVDPGLGESEPTVAALTGDPELRAAIEAAITQRDEGTAAPREATLIRRDGSPVEALVAVSRADRAGAAFLVALDVTEMRSLETRLRQLDRLQAVADLTGGLAHHFNNILTGAIGYAELARSAMPPGQARDDLDTSLANSQRAVALTRQLLAFGGREMSTPETIDAREVIDSLRPRLASQLPKEVAIEVRSCEAPCVVRFERRRLERVLNNVVANAGDAMPDGGRLTITTTIVVREGGPLADGTVLAPGPYVRITVTDTGVGMDDETLARVFEPFFTTKGPSRGVGMGIPATYGLVRQAGGIVEFTSSPGAGTTVSIDLPIAEAGGGPEPRARIG